MASLKLLTCIRIIRYNEYSLDEIIELAKDDENALGLVCAKEPDFWKFIITEFFGNLEILSRLDLRPNDLKIHTMMLNNKIKRQYSITADLGNSHKIIRFGEGKFSDDLQGDLVNKDFYPTTFTIDGLKPRGGNIGYLVRFYYDDPPLYKTKQEVDENGLLVGTKKYFISSFEEAENLYFVTMTYLLEEFIRQLKNEHPSQIFTFFPMLSKIPYIFEDYPTVQELLPLILREKNGWRDKDLRIFNTNDQLGGFVWISIYPETINDEDNFLVNMFIDMYQLYF
jgi:hypothetical protein